MSLKQGDTVTLDNFTKLVANDEQRLQSMGLFTNVKCNVVDWHEDRVSIKVNVVENWYIFPYVIFELADRNFNVWRKEFNCSFDRVNYGLGGVHINLTGHKDKLRLKWQSGFTKKYDIFYEFPYIYKGWGASTNYLYAESKQVGYLPSNNLLKFYKDKSDKVIFSQHLAHITFHKRASAYLNHQFRVEYNDIKIDDAISSNLNPRYLGDGRSRLKFVQLDYLLDWNRTIYPLYPTGGYQMIFNLRKDGLGKDLNNLWASLDVSYHTPISTRWILSNRIKTKIHLLDQAIPYYLYKGVGYNDDILSGYQLQVLEGRNFFLNNNSLKYKLFDLNLISKFKLPKAMNSINLKAFARITVDYAYVYDPDYRELNPLNNSHQLGYSVGLDLVILNNLDLSADYSIRKDGISGFFFGGGVNF
jgi:outer membrane protein assembly factor BamA